jgi:glycosyltransferase involved in cell wall biosynthesis
MKILHLSNVAGRLGGGISEVVHALLYWQHKLGYSSTLWFLSKQSQVDEIANDNKIDQNRLFAIRLVFGFRFLISPSSFLKLNKFKKEVDLIHQHGIFLPISLLTLSVNKKKKVIISPHGLLEPEKLKYSSFKKSVALRLFENKNLKSCDCLVACSEQEALSLRDFGLSQPIVILPNGVSESIIRKKPPNKKDLGFKLKHDIRPNTRILLFLSRIHPFKGLELFLECILAIKDEFRKNNWIFVIAGINELSHEEKLKIFVENNDLSHIVRFIGPQYKQDKLDAFDSASCFILPSKGENFGITVIEALARGLPVITTRTTPWKELEDFDCGWWIERTKKDFINTLLELFSKDEGDLAKMGENGVRLVEEKYTWSNVTHQSIQMYKWVLSDFDEKYKKEFYLLK